MREPLSDRPAQRQADEFMLMRFRRFEDDILRGSVGYFPCVPGIGFFQLRRLECTLRGELQLAKTPDLLFVSPTGE